MTDTPKPADPGAILLAYGMLPTPEEILAIDCTACKAKAGELCRPGNWICEVRVQEAIRIRRAAAAEPAERLFSSDEVRAAFRAAFHRSGEAFFPYPDMGADDEACEQATREGADSVVEALKRAAAAPEPIPFVASRPEVGEAPPDDRLLVSPPTAIGCVVRGGKCYSPGHVHPASFDSTASQAEKCPSCGNALLWLTYVPGQMGPKECGTVGCPANRREAPTLDDIAAAGEGLDETWRGLSGGDPGWVSPPPPYNHTRGDSVLTPCPLCAAVRGDAEPPHPSPWRWTQDGEDLVSRLVDANGEVLIETKSFIGARLRLLTERAQALARIAGLLADRLTMHGDVDGEDGRAIDEARAMLAGIPQ
jgi:hypothetical protein